MSTVEIRAALEGALNAIAPAIATAWENVNEPGSSTYQDVWLMLARPENPTMGDDFYRQRGYLQVNLNYPQNAGPNAAQARAELIRSTFKRGLSFTVNGITTTVEETPEIGNGSYDGDKYKVPVFIRFFANVQH